MAGAARDAPAATGSPPPASPSLGALAVATVTMALWLHLIQALLGSPGGPGIEDWLGWADASPASATRALMRWWAEHGLQTWAWVYLAGDSLVFLPLYAACLGRAAHVLADGLCEAGPSARGPRHRVVVRVLLLPLAVLVVVDLAENLLGLWRLGGLARLTALPVTALAAVVAWRGVGVFPGVRHLIRQVNPGLRTTWAVATVAGVALLVVAGLGTAQCSDRPPWPWGDTPLAWWWGCASHQGKLFSTATTAAVLLAALGGWLFGLNLQPRSDDDPIAQRLQRAWQAQRRAERARLRAAIGDMLVRSRYVLAVLGLLTVLTLVMDQGRDIVHAMAYGLWPPQLPSAAALTAGGRTLRVLGAVASLVASAGALWLFCFACWLWTRSVCMLRSVHTPPRPGDDPPRLEDGYAQGWARVLAWVPALVITLLLGAVMRDTARAAADGAALVQWVLLGMGSAVLLMGARFLQVRGGQPGRTHYYDSDDWLGWLHAAGIVPAAGATDARFRALGRLPPHHLPAYLAVGLLAVRIVDALPAGWLGQASDVLPTMVLAVILFSLGLWLCLFGWLSLLEHHRAIPWVGLLLVITVAMGAAGWTENHVVSGPLQSNAMPETALWRLLGHSSLVMAALMAGYLVTVRVVRRHARAAAERRAGTARPVEPLLTRGEWVRLAAVALALAAAIAAADRLAGMRDPMPGAAAEQPDPRPSLDQALAHWLRGLCPDPSTPGCAGEGGAALPVYLVSTEGGGIRAAVWTAFALHHLASAQPRFLERTFAISGVSGGAVGATVFRACDRAERAGIEPRAACLQRLAATDLLAPLLSSWLVEDALARVMPSQACATPGCTILSRGTWFESAMEASVPGLRSGLVETGPARAAVAAAAATAGGESDAASVRSAHRPYLLLNSTWVETGARAIGSDLRVGDRSFADARDVLGLVGHDLPLSVAAHNAARFPYINPIGALRADPAACGARVVGAWGGGGAGRPVCGHLADGGYFDNSGAQGTADLLGALQQCLLVQPGQAQAAAWPACMALGEPLRSHLRARLVPQVLMVRNSADPMVEAAPQCQHGVQRPAMSAADVVPVRAQGCLALNDGGYRPERPVCAGVAGGWIGLSGPVLTVLHAIGTGAGGQLAEARQVQAVRMLRQRLGGAAATTGSAEVTVIDLLPDGTRYPLGWHLSPAAVAGLWAQAGGCRLAVADR